MTEPKSESISPVSNSEQAPDSGVQIEEHNGKAFTLDVMKRLQLAGLSRRGFDISIDPESEDSYLDYIYGAPTHVEHPENFTTTFIATKDGKAVGALSLNLVRDKEGNQSGQKFWKKLRERNPELARKAAEISDTSLDVWTIVVDPDEREQGIARNLFTEPVNKFTPPSITGLSKSEAVMARAKILDELGYRTFFGEIEVTPGASSEPTTVHQSILEAYFAGAESQRNEDGTVTYHGPHLKPDTPNVEGAPDNIKAAFRPLIEAQNKKPNMTFVLPLVSIRRELLPDPPLAA